MGECNCAFVPKLSAHKFLHIHNEKTTMKKK